MELYELLRSCTSIKKLRVDFGTVERGADFVEARSLLNSTINQADLSVCIDYIEGS